jgi:lipopolysaccharide export LptBFGC system permease protein LptF
MLVVWPPKAEGPLPMSPFLSLFVPVFLFLMLLTIGFSMRERNIGVLMMWIGTLGIFGLTCWTILEKLPT